MTDQLTRLLTLILLGFALSGCIHAQVPADPHSLDLDAGVDPDVDSVVDEMTPVVVLDSGDAVPTQLGIDELAERVRAKMGESPRVIRAEPALVDVFGPDIDG